jgi:hypothetical protein
VLSVLKTEEVKLNKRNKTEKHYATDSNTYTMIQTIEKQKGQKKRMNMKLQ